MHMSSGQCLAVAGVFTVQIRGLKSGQFYHKLEGYRRPINSVQYAPRLLSGSVDRHIGIWSVISGDLLHYTPTWWDDEVFHALYSTDGKTFATALCTGIVKLFDAPSGEFIHTFQHPVSEIERVAYSPGGQYLAAFDCSGCCLWDLTTREGMRMNGPPNLFWRMQFLDEKWAVGGATDGSCRVSGRSTNCIGLEGRVSRHVGPGRVVVWATGKEDCEVYSLAYEPLAVGAKDGSATILRGDTGEFVGELQGHSARIMMIMSTLDDKTLLSYSDDGINARLWVIADAMNLYNDQ